MRDTAELTRKFAALADLGLERTDLVPVETEAVAIERGRWKVVRARPAMGTLVAVTVVAPSREWAQDAIGEAFGEMDRLIAHFSRYRDDSAICALNAAGHLEDAPPELHRVVQASLEYHALTDGAFDVTVAPLLALFRDRLLASIPSEPTDGEIRNVLALVGARGIECAGRRIRLPRAGMALTLDGIAKGFIVDAIAHTLESCGVRRYLVNAGGDIRSRGKKEGRRPWTVAVRDPTRPGGLLQTVPLTRGAVATSGSYEISFDGDMRFHHIVDATTGRSPSAALSVSVMAPTAMAADALATSVFVLGPAAGVRFIERLRGCACLVLARDGGRWCSKRWCGTPLTDGHERGT